MNPILEPLVLEKKKNVIVEVDNNLCECLLCNDTFDLHNSNDSLLAHLLLQHKLVIADIKDVVDLKRFIKKLYLKNYDSSSFIAFCTLQVCRLLEGAFQISRPERILLCHES